MKSIPAWAERLLRIICPEELYDEIEGDLIEIYNREVKTIGMQKAKLQFVVACLRFIRPGILLRNKFYLKFMDMTMTRKNVVLAVRQIRKDWAFSVINIFGLSISMAACLLIFHYAQFELSYDRQYKDGERIYRVATNVYDGDQARYTSAQCFPKLAPILKEQLADVVETGRLMPHFWFTCMLSYEQNGETKIFNEDKLYYADQGYLFLFQPTLLLGDADKALTKPFSIVLSASSAKKYFGDENPIGKVLHLKGSGDENDYVVTGVMVDPAYNSHIDAEILLSENSINDRSASGFQSAYTYVKVRSETSTQKIQEKFPDLVKAITPPGNINNVHLFMQPVRDIHFATGFEDDMKTGGSLNSIYFLLLVAVAILIIAWINYINLTSARSAARIKEIGIRKVTGATRSQITFQFLTETIVMNCTGLIGAVILVILFGPTFYRLIELPIPLDSFGGLWNINSLITAGVFLLLILLIALIPARILSSYSPINAIKGKIRQSRNGVSFRKTAVIFQFVCAITLTIAVVVFNRQFNFMNQQELGVDITQAIVAKSPANVDSSYLRRLTLFRNELKSLAIVRSVTTSTSVPGENINWTGEVKRENGTSSQDFRIHVIDPDFISSFHLNLLTGRNVQESDFPQGNFGDKLEAVLLNREAVNRLGYKNPEDVIGERIFWGEDLCVVVGVIDNFHQQSLKESFQPTLYTANRGPAMTIKLTDGAGKYLSKTLPEIQQAWNTYFPNNPFDYYFLEDSYNDQYASDERIGRLFQFFCSLALIISSLGLFALSLFSIGQRAKEITIRKILGAPVLHLMHLLTREFSFLLLVAMAISVPMTFYGLDRWLDGFAYRVSIDIWTCIIPILVVGCIAGLTVGGQTLKAALRNPTHGLKHE